MVFVLLNVTLLGTFSISDCTENETVKQCKGEFYCAGNFRASLRSRNKMLGRQLRRQGLRMCFSLPSATTTPGVPEGLNKSQENFRGLLATARILG